MVGGMVSPIFHRMFGFETKRLDGFEPNSCYYCIQTGVWDGIEDKPISPSHPTISQVNEGTVLTLGQTGYRVQILYSNTTQSIYIRFEKDNSYKPWIKLGA